MTGKWYKLLYIYIWSSVYIYAIYIHIYIAYIHVEMYCPKACLLLPESLINKSILIVCLVLSGSKNGGGDVIVLVQKNLESESRRKDFK